MGSPWNFVSAQGSEKTRMMGLSDDRKSFRIGLAVLNTIPECDSQPPSHVAVAITLNAKASSLKIDSHYIVGFKTSANMLSVNTV